MCKESENDFLKCEGDHGIRGAVGTAENFQVFNKKRL